MVNPVALAPATSSEGNQKCISTLLASLLASPIGEKHEIPVVLKVKLSYSPYRMVISQ